MAIIDRSTPLDQLPLVFFDFETTGLDLSQGHRICEVAMLRVRGTLIEDCLFTLVNPQRPLDPEAAQINKLSDAELAKAPPFAAIIGRLRAITKGAVLIAHNLPFDMAFLHYELSRLNQPPILEPTLDTLGLSRRLLKRGSYSLYALAQDLGAPIPNHRALADVLALRGVFEHLRMALEEQEITALEDAQRYERGFLPGMDEPKTSDLISRAILEQRNLLIRYHAKGNSEPSTRVIHPYYLTREQRGVYLRAFCELRHDIRNFLLDRIEVLELR